MSMIEQVAKAIAPVIERDNDIYWAGEYGRPMPQESAERVARAAIEAMREATLDMWDAGDLAIPVSPPADKPSYALAAWQAMIDEALKAD